MMEKKGWKITAIILMVVLGLLIAWISWGFYLLDQEEKDIAYCYYDICEEYPQAELDDKVCTCYDYDLIGSLEVIKQKYIG